MYRGYLPLILETARLLAVLVGPNHLVRLSSWGLTHLPSPCHSNDFGYILAATTFCRSVLARQNSGARAHYNDGLKADLQIIDEEVLARNSEFAGFSIYLSDAYIYCMLN